MRIFVKEIILGTHKWEGCDIKAVEFLKNEHHHNFEIYFECDVTHLDRELEFIVLRNWIKEAIKKSYPVVDGIVRFGCMSCEMIALDLSNQFKLDHVNEINRHLKIVVSEDGVQGGILNE